MQELSATTHPDLTDAETKLPTLHPMTARNPDAMEDPGDCAGAGGYGDDPAQASSSNEQVTESSSLQEEYVADSKVIVDPLSTLTACEMSDLNGTTSALQQQQRESSDVHGLPKQVRSEDSDIRSVASDLDVVKSEGRRSSSLCAEQGSEDGVEGMECDEDLSQVEMETKEPIPTESTEACDERTESRNTDTSDHVLDSKDSSSDDKTELTLCQADNTDSKVDVCDSTPDQPPCDLNDQSNTTEVSHCNSHDSSTATTPEATLQPPHTECSELSEDSDVDAPALEQSSTVESEKRREESFENKDGAESGEQLTDDGEHFMDCEDSIPTETVEECNTEEHGKSEDVDANDLNKSSLLNDQDVKLKPDQPRNLLNDYCKTTEAAPCDIHDSIDSNISRTSELTLQSFSESPEDGDADVPASDLNKAVKNEERSKDSCSDEDKDNAETDERTVASTDDDDYMDCVESQPGEEKEEPVATLSIEECDRNEPSESTGIAATYPNKGIPFDNQDSDASSGTPHNTNSNHIDSKSETYQPLSSFNGHSEMCTVTPCNGYVSDVLTKAHHPLSFSSEQLNGDIGNEPPEDYLRLSFWSPTGEHDQQEMAFGETFSKTDLAERTNVEAAFFMEEAIFKPEKEDKRVLRCYNARLENSQYIDPKDASYVEMGSCFYFARRFLSSLSSLPRPPSRNHFPIVKIETDNEFVTVDDGRHLVKVEEDVLKDHTFAVMILGIRQISRYYWRVVGGGFVNSDSGQIFDTRNDVPGRGKRNHVICMLRQGDRPPFVKLPIDTYLQVFCREGLEVRMKGRRVSVDQKVTDMERWVTPSNSRGYNLEIPFSSAASARISNN